MKFCFDFYIVSFPDVAQASDYVSYHRGRGVFAFRIRRFVIVVKFSGFGNKKCE